MAGTDQRQRQPGKMQVAVIKAHDTQMQPIKKSDVVTQLTPQEAYNAGDWITHPVDMRGLETLVHNSSILPQCIRAYRSNIAGFGIGVKYKDDLEETPEMAAEFDRAREVVELLNTEQDTKEVFEDLIEAREIYGIAYLEVIRDFSGNVVQIEFIQDIPSVDKTKPVGAYIDVPFFHNGKELTRKKRFCKYRQQIGGQTVYFREFGDPRIMDRRDGVYLKKGETLNLEYQANEILEFAIGIKPYGEVRWIGQVLGVDGSRRAESLNNNYFINGRHTPLLILLQNGTLTEESYVRLQRYMDDIKGEAGQHAFILLESETTEGKTDFEINDKPNVEIKELASILQKDELFQDYLDNNRRRVQSAFQLPDLYVGYTTDFNRATAQTAQEVTEEQVFQPERRSLAWAVNNRLLSGYNFQYVEVFFQEPNISNPDDTYRMLTVLNNAGGLTMNKAKDLLYSLYGEVSEDYPEDWGDLPLAMASRQQSSADSAAGLDQLQTSMANQIQKAAAENNTEIVAVMREVKKLLEKGLTNPTSGSIINKWDESQHPRDESGKFTDGGGTGNSSAGRYNAGKIIGKITSNGDEVKTVSNHAQQRMRERHISANKVAAVLSSNDSVITKGHDGNDLYFKDNVRVVFDKSSGTVVTCVRRSKP
ncbi:MAG: phage portal protein [Oscillospiraceae bacterium]|nr:phage portal protein [Oscillospiraceae bacterium]